MQPNPPTLPAGPDPAETASLAQVAEFLGLLGRSVRAYQIYQPNNPVYQRFVGAVRTSFLGLWERMPELRIDVTESVFVYQEQPTAVGEGRDSLPFAFYKDGIRQLRFFPGFEEELDRFLELVKRARSMSGEEDDLVTLLWQEEFSCLQYAYVDLLADGAEIPVAEPPPVGAIAREELDREIAEAVDLDFDLSTATNENAPTAISRDDFRETLYFLSADELEALQADLDEDWNRPLKGPVLNALFDRLEDPIPSRQLEIVGILRQITPSFLGRGDMKSAALILRELDGILKRDLLAAEARVEVDQFFDELSEPDVAFQLVQSLESGDIDPDSGSLSVFLARLRPRALPVLLQMAESTATPRVRERLVAAVDRLGAEHAAYVLQALGSPDEATVRGAVRLAGRLRLAAAAGALVSLLTHPSAELRAAAVQALTSLRSASALDGLRRALQDPAREVRIAAARGLGSLRFQPARETFETAIEGRELREADLTEKLAFFEAYAAVGGADAVPLLDRILNGKSMLGRRQPGDLRACAASALGHIPSPRARAALEKAEGDTDTVVRAAVARALRQEVAAS